MCRVNSDKLLKKMFGQMLGYWLAVAEYKIRFGQVDMDWEPKILANVSFFKKLVSDIYHYETNIIFVVLWNRTLIVLIHNSHWLQK